MKNIFKLKGQTPIELAKSANMPLPIYSLTAVRNESWASAHAHTSYDERYKYCNFLKPASFTTPSVLSQKTARRLLAKFHINRKTRRYRDTITDFKILAGLLDEIITNSLVGKATAVPQHNQIIANLFDISDRRIYTFLLELSKYLPDYFEVKIGMPGTGRKTATVTSVVPTDKLTQLYDNTDLTKLYSSGISSQYICKEYQSLVKKYRAHERKVTKAFKDLLHDHTIEDALEVISDFVESQAEMMDEILIAQSKLTIKEPYSVVLGDIGRRMLEQVKTVMHIASEVTSLGVLNEHLYTHHMQWKMKVLNCSDINLVDAHLYLRGYNDFSQLSAKERLQVVDEHWNGEEVVAVDVNSSSISHIFMMNGEQPPENFRTQFVDIDNGVTDSVIKDVIMRVLYTSNNKELHGSLVTLSKELDIKYTILSSLSKSIIGQLKSLPESDFRWALIGTQESMLHLSVLIKFHKEHGILLRSVHDCFYVAKSMVDVLKQYINEAAFELYGQRFVVPVSVETLTDFEDVQNAA